jgi:GNAT superfamily N-acetyltransferase
MVGGVCQMRQLYSVRNAKLEEQRDLSRLCVRATIHAGHDEAFIDRAVPALTITVPAITGGSVQVAEDKAGRVLGVMWVMPSPLPSIAQLHGIFVDPPFWGQGVGRVLFGAAVTRAKQLKAGALVISAEPSAEGFYKRMGAIKIGQAPFFFSPDVILPYLLYVIHGET